MKFKLSLVFVCTLIFLFSCKKKTAFEKTEAYFQEIEADTEKLNDFFDQMPKGGELHHHAIGSVFAEDLIDIAIEEACFINPHSYELYRTNADALNQLIPDENVLPIALYINQDEDNKDRIIDAWSIRNYQKNGRNGHDWFFASFFKFKEAFYANTPKCLNLLGNLASKENVQYLETMIAVPDVVEEVLEQTKSDLFDNESLNKAPIGAWLDYMYITLLDSTDMKKLVKDNIDSLNAIYQKSNFPEDVKVKFMAYGLRIFPNLSDVFAETMLNFMTADQSDLVVGVNFVAPEDNIVAIQDYLNHMYVFSYFHKKFPNVKISLHAGELTEGMNEMVDSNLDNHIWQAINIGNASRIGHGVDVLFEHDSDSLMNLMRNNSIAVEINLRSNQVILELDESNHPFINYWQAKVPVCLSTDDAGILRTNLSSQYLLAKEYVPSLTYADIKEIVYNSVKYSFLTDAEKTELIEKMDEEFSEFEDSIWED